MDLQIEKMVKKNDEMLVTQCRLKQRSDKKETKFLVPVRWASKFCSCH